MLLGVQIAELFASGTESGSGKAAAAAAAGTAETAAGGAGRRGKGKGKGSMASNTLATKFRDNLTTLM